MKTPTNGHPPFALKTLVVHPALYRAFRKRAIDHGLTVAQAFHDLLCRELGREDLLGDSPRVVRDKDGKPLRSVG